MIEHRSSHGRHATSLVAWVFALAVVAMAVGIALVSFLLRTPYQGYAGEEVIVTVAPRTPSASVFESLQSKGVLRDWRLGMVALKVLHPGKTLKAGEYRFAGPRTPEQVVLSIVAGDVVTYRITVPEGFTADEIFRLFSSQSFSTMRDFQALFQKPDELEGVPKDAPSLEGFLFPDTYVVTRSMGAREILTAMTRQFVRRLPEGFEQKARAQGMTLLQATTLASLVEKETAVTAERPIVAAVYRNRLRKGMLLQCDPTTIYALKRLGIWRGSLARSELALDEPFNTYVNPGLPPGPICNPGLASLRAAIAPADVSFLYFVAVGDGSHSFSADYEEQQRNASRYRQTRRAAQEADR
ncbi:MAG TPA: endolytic transglycosylase MltG [Thermoanaerobaculia bacterium]|nr:endolytic transglycosylase MltG [Thermoanaerobaculia bacterium]